MAAMHESAGADRDCLQAVSRPEEAAVLTARFVTSRSTPASEGETQPAVTVRLGASRLQREVQPTGG